MSDESAQLLAKTIKKGLSDLCWAMFASAWVIALGLLW